MTAHHLQIYILLLLILIQKNKQKPSLIENTIWERNKWPQIKSELSVPLLIKTTEKIRGRGGRSLPGGCWVVSSLSLSWFSAMKGSRMSKSLRRRCWRRRCECSWSLVYTLGWALDPFWAESLPTAELYTYSCCCYWPTSPRRPLIGRRWPGRALIGPLPPWRHQKVPDLTRTCCCCCSSQNS